MYSNIFDTVRKTGWDQYNVEGTLYTSILSGMHPTLSLNQAIDNQALILLCQQHPEVLELIADGVIRIAPFGKYSENDILVDPIFDYLQDALTYPKSGEDKTPFEFSCMPFLKEFNPEETEAIYNRMKKVLTNRLKYFSYNIASPYDVSEKKFPLTLSNHSEQIEWIDQYLITVQKIMEAARGQYLWPSKNRPVNNTLPHRIRYAAKRLKESNDPVQAGFLDGIDALLEYIQVNAGKRKLTDSRSNLYKVIDSMDHTSQYSTEIKEFVDLCYNEVVATSLNDNEKDIMAAKKESSNIGIYIRNEDKDYVASGQKFELLSHTPSDVDTISWPKLKSVLSEIRSLNVADEEWKECMEKVLWKHEIKSLHLAGKQFVSGSLKFTANLITKYYTANEFLKNDTLDWKVRMIVGGAELVDGLFSGRDTLLEMKNSISALKDACEYSRMQEYLTQTTYLRRDYAEEAEE